MAKIVASGANPEGLDRLLAIGLETEGAQVDLTDRLPQRIDRYEILRILGEGGMGVVYLAQQTSPVRRQVALKVVKPGMDSKQVLARFRAEQQTLALLSHPHIASVHDAGLTELHYPYFVMEYVAGLPITQYCDEHQLTIEQRLLLYLQVCQAIQHAHQKGVIHRDVKPSNVLVSHADDRPLVKVIDFGVARALDHTLSDETVLTQRGQMLGTPEYMSPEQARMVDRDIDTRTDVYSLGVLLYELLVGVLPFDPEMFRKEGIDRLRQVICEQEPQTPSTRLSTVNRKRSEELAGRRDTNLHALRQRLQGDLDWITLKALEKDPTRRYETVHALAMDVENFLACRPVSAVRPSAVYRLKKYMQRHRLQTVTVGLTILLAIVSLASISLWQQHKTQIGTVQAVLDRETLSQARDAFMRRQFRHAFHLAKSVVQSKSVGSEARLLYAASLVEGKRPNEASQALNRLLREEPEIAGVAHSLLARIAWESEVPESEKLQQVQLHQEKAEELLPETVEAYYLRALTTVSIPEALSLLAKAIDEDPRHYQSRKLRAIILNASGRHEDALQDALAMIVVQPQDPLGYSLRAASYAALGQYEAAVHDHQKALALPPLDDEQTSRTASEYLRCLLFLGRYEEVISRSSELADDLSDQTAADFFAFCGHVGLGQNTQAEAIYQRVAESSRNAATAFVGRIMKYVFDMMCAGRSWHPADGAPGGKSLLPMLEAEEQFRHVTRRDAEILQGSGFQADWCPDGDHLAYSLGAHGFSGLALLDMNTRETALLTIPGKNPRWSPDGRWIAFVRDHQVLSVADVTSADVRYQPRSTVENEIWIIRSDGSQARRVAKGNWPTWMSDSEGLFYYSPFEKDLFRVYLDSREEPEFACSLPKCLDVWPAVSPDNRFLAFVEYDQVKVLDLSTQSVAQTWTGPPGVWNVSWTPDGKVIYVAGQANSEVRAGLWIYELGKKEAFKAIPGQVMHACENQAGRLAFTLGPPYYRICLGRNRDDFLAQSRTLQNHYREMIDHYTRILKADPSDDMASFFAAEYGQYLKATFDPQGLGSEQSGFVLGTPVNVGPALNTPHNEGTPFFSSDGLTLYFTSDRPGGLGTHDLWCASRDSIEEDWRHPVPLGETINTPAWAIWPCPSADGLDLYFFSYRKGGLGSGDIWVAHRANPSDPWGPPVNAGLNINSPYYDGAPTLSADGLEMIFVSARFGPPHLWVSRRASAEDDWGEATNLGPTVNGLHVDAGPCLCQDGLTLFFHSTRPGGMGFYDIYVTHRQTRDSRWTQPVNLGRTINTEVGEICPSVSPDGRWLYFCDYPTHPREGGLGKADLWKAPILQWPDRETFSQIQPPE